MNQRLCLTRAEPSQGPRRAACPWSQQVCPPRAQSLSLPRGQALTTDPTSPDGFFKAGPFHSTQSTHWCPGKELKAKASRETMEKLSGFSDP